mgnify:CR=1 FL=1
MFRYPIFKTTILVTSASSVYIISSHRSGNLDIVPFRSINYIQEKMDTFPDISQYRKNPAYMEINPAYIETTSKLAESTINSRNSKRGLQDK